MENYVEEYKVVVLYCDGKLFKTTWLSPITEKISRVDGPAIEWADGSQYWYLNGQVHRLDGPALVFPSGKVSYYIDGKFYAPEAFKEEVARRNAPSTPPNPCNGKVVEFEGKKYQLKLVG